MQKDRVYGAIDLKSFYASVECVARGLDPLTTNLVVADVSRTEKTICLAVSPSLKKYGIKGRARLFEVVQKMRDVNNERRSHIADKRFKGKSYSATELSMNPELEIDYIAAVPRMGHYIEVSCDIYEVYLKYIAPEDIHVYSIDEIFFDMTDYLKSYKMSPHELMMTIIKDVLATTGITATGGIGTNMYLAKVAMDIVAKHIPADEDGVRIAELDEMSYREKLWSHRPITDFWRVGRGIAERLSRYGIYTMGDVALWSIDRESVLYKQFGVNAELLIDHAWGWEPCTIADVKAYKPEVNSLSSGQVLQEAYSVKKAKVVLREMADQMALDLVDKKKVADQFGIYIGYDVADVPTHSYVHGSANIGKHTSSSRLIVEAVISLYDRIVNPNFSIRRINITANNVIDEVCAKNKRNTPFQLDLFADNEEIIRNRKEETVTLEKERKIQNALLNIKKKFGKNAILKGTDFEEGATAKERNNQIGGHKA